MMMMRMVCYIFVCYCTIYLEEQLYLFLTSHPFADEDFETAVRNLNGKLYPDQLEVQSVAASSGRLDALIKLCRHQFFCSSYRFFV